ncbi:unnamed protein product [Linum trigynum]|uniref:GDSL esterase/lipase n=1 Tax=Linum trigynum TaxID=586398 RepID=A0AAV2DX64_9ROSI
MDSFPTFVTAILLLLLVPQKPLSCRASNDDDRDGAESPVLGGCVIAAIYNFGDSFSDTGNALAEYPDGPMGNFPNGMTIHNATGRFCDGHLIIDHIAEAAGLPYLNPYLRKDLDQSKGTNFAVGGVGLLSNKTRTKLNVQLPFSQDSVDIQLTWLEEHLNRTFGDHETARRNHLKSSLFVFTGGSGNDYTNIRGNFSSPPLEKMKAIIPDVVAAVKDYLKKLIIEYGVSKVVVTGLYKAGCTVDVGIFHDYKPRCNTSTNAVAALHNRILK